MGALFGNVRRVFAFVGGVVVPWRSSRRGVMRRLVLGSIFLLAACGGYLGTVDEGSVGSDPSSLRIELPTLSNTATFDNADGGSDGGLTVTYCGGSGQSRCSGLDDTAQVRWGEPIDGGAQSGL